MLLDDPESEWALGVLAEHLVEGDGPHARPERLGCEEDQP